MNAELFAKGESLGIHDIGGGGSVVLMPGTIIPKDMAVEYMRNTYEAVFVASKDGKYNHSGWERKGTASQRMANKEE